MLMTMRCQLPALLLCVLLSCSLLLCPAHAAATSASSSSSSVRRVHVIMSNHLDVGFNTVGTTPWKWLAADVIDLYTRTYFPRALHVNEELRQMRQNGSNPLNRTLTWTTHSWLVSLYFDCPQHMGFYCPSDAEKQAVQAGIERREITWHGFPFNGEMELFTPELVRFGVDLSRRLARDHRRPGPLPNTVSQRDVPGTTAAVIPILADAGIRAISIGTNFGSAPVEVPAVSVWKQPHGNSSVFLLYHGRGYGGIANYSDYVTVEGWSEAAVWDWNGDNSGPASALQVIANFEYIAALWPEADVVMSTFEQYVELLDAAYARGEIKLPVYSREMGDTWIHGSGTDPLRVAKWRALSRLHSDCLRDPHCPSSDFAFHNFSRLLLKLGEHTWGSDVKQLLRYSDPLHWQQYYDWTNANLTHFLAVNNTDYFTLVQSWIEQRRWALDIPLSALPASHPILPRAAAAFAAISPPLSPPDTDGYTAQRIEAGDLAVLTVGRLNLSVEGDYGRIIGLQDAVSGMQWADSEHPLGELWYQTFDESHSYATFLAEYISFGSMDQPGTDQYPRYDFGKRGLDASAHPEVLRIRPELVNRTFSYRIPGEDGSDATLILPLAYPAHVHRQYGAPLTSFLTVHLVNSSSSSPSLRFVLVQHNKTRTRIPEAGWLSFHPVNADSRVAAVHKLDSWLELSEGVLGNGSLHLHAVSAEGGVRVRELLQARSPDVALVCIGYPPTPFPTPLATIVGDGAAVSFNLFNNIWGVNYAMSEHVRTHSPVRWYPYLPEDSSQQYRVEIRLLQKERSRKEKPRTAAAATGATELPDSTRGRAEFF